MVNCPQCHKPVVDSSHFCPACGAEVRPDQPKLTEEESGTEMIYLLLFGLGGMALFFAFGFLLAGVTAMSEMLIVSGILALIGTIMVALGAFYRRKLKRAIKERRMQSRCEYCGGDNPDGVDKCQFCGAPRW